MPLPEPLVQPLAEQASKGSDLKTSKKNQTPYRSGTGCTGREPVVGIFDSAGVSAAATGFEHPLLDYDTTFAVSPDEPFFENVQPEELLINLRRVRR